MTAISLAIALSGTSGCATIFSGGQSRLEVDVEAPESPVLTTVQGIDSGDRDTRSDRHFEVPVERTSTYVILSSGDGLGHTIKVVRPRVNPWVYTNVGWLIAGAVLSAASPTRTIDSNTGEVLSSVPNGSYMAMGMLAALAGAGLDVLTHNAWNLERREVRMVLDRQAPTGEATP
jgi:hypothetical protein